MISSVQSNAYWWWNWKMRKWQAMSFLAWVLNGMQLKQTHGAAQPPITYLDITFPLWSLGNLYSHRVMMLIWFALPSWTENGFLSYFLAGYFAPCWLCWVVLSSPWTLWALPGQLRTRPLCDASGGIILALASLLSLARRTSWCLSLRVLLPSCVSSPHP